MLPNEILLSDLNEQFPCRERQIRPLATLFNQSFPTPPSIVIHGLEGTGKSAITRAVLEAVKTPHAIVDSRECITGRQLLEHTLAASLEAISIFYGDSVDPAQHGRCENLSALQVHLERLLEGKKLVLVFDGIDRQREAPGTLIPALARFGELIQCLSVVFIISVPSPRLFHTTGIPHLHFPPYGREDSIRILSLSPPKIFDNGLDPSIDYTEEEAAEDDAWVWDRYCGVVWDSLGKGAAVDLVSFRSVCEKLWKPFTAPILDGTFGTRDFARLMVSRRTLFQNEDALISRIIPGESGLSKATPKVVHELPYYSKFILCASYLASYNPARQDPIFFMKSSEKKRKRRAAGAAAGKASKHRKIPRSLLAPSPFALDRMLAILHAVLPHALPLNADLLTQIATLASLRLLVRAGTTSADMINVNSKWRVNYGWEFVAGLGRSVGLEMRDYLGGGLD